ncbi:hypothetical protein EWM64_g7140 [Hericium alpestre]|uniref:Uncharacterized protein n=1 Tax=Hericium alpestre TaxID=135208 RepID=A0A4Y9ZQ17_9AGAM|nr:hypothetical protein EWM64_g7140 [Hericium alpestre]
MIPDPERQLAVEGERANENAETPLLMLHDRVILNNIVGASIPAQRVAENIMALLTSARHGLLHAPDIFFIYSCTTARILYALTALAAIIFVLPTPTLKQDNKPSESLGRPAAILAGLLGTIAGANGLAVVMQQALGKGSSRFAVEMSRSCSPRFQMRGVGGQTTSDEQDARVDVADRCAVPRVPVSVAVLAARASL